MKRMENMRIGALVILIIAGTVAQSREHQQVSIWRAPDAVRVRHISKQSAPEHGQRTEHGQRSEWNHDLAPWLVSGASSGEMQLGLHS